jgi:hypothetical protein
MQHIIAAPFSPQARFLTPTFWYKGTASMAYTYVSAMVRATRQSVEWTAANLSQVPLNSIIQDYYEVSIELSNPFDPAPTYLTTATLQQVMPQSIPSPTLAAWLISLGNEALPTIATAPSTTTTPVRYADGWQAGWVAKLTDMYAAPDAPLPDGAKNDLLLTKTGLDMASMSNYVLVSVNGYLHLSGGSLNGLYVKDGGKTMRIANDNHFGIFSFLPIGTVQQIPIKPTMIYKPNSNWSYKDAVWVDLGVSLTNKIVLLSLGGYLHVLDGTYLKTGDQTIKINFNRIAFPERLYQSIGSIDLSSLPLNRGPSGAASEQFSVSSLYSDAVIAAYLCLSQSFAIVVDCQDFYTARHDLEASCVPGRYFGSAALRYPLMGAYGRLYDYRLSQEEDTYVYGCDSMRWDHFLFETMDWQNYLSIGPNREGSRRWSNAKGYLLEFGSYT